MDKSRNSNRDQTPEPWGHKMITKPPHTTRILAININGIGVKRSNEKCKSLRMWIQKNKVDVTCISETNVNWSKVRTMHTLWDRTKQWFEHRVLGVAYNTRQRIIGKEKKQQGGTATLLKDKVAHRHRDNGFDATGLGRWSWVRISGKQGCTTRFVTVYCPVKTSSKGLDTVYAQQLNYLSEDPTRRFWLDLGEQIITWHAEGEQVVIGGDWNEDVQQPLFMEWMHTVGLKDSVTSMHEGRAPATYQNGRDPIDGIFISKDMSPSRSGYLGFGDIPGDHRGIWVDIPNTEILGYNMNDIAPPLSRRLKLDDPRVVKKYLELLDNLFRQEKVYKQMKHLQKMSEDQENIENIKKEYDKVDLLRYSCMIKAERQCRKLKCGGVLWSPKLQRARNMILFWTLVLKKRKKRLVSARRILRLKKKLQITGEVELTNKEVKEKLDKAYDKYKQLRSQDADLRFTYQEALAQAKADKEGGDAVKKLRALQDREQLRIKYKRIGSSLKQRKQRTTKIHVKTPEGFIEITQMQTMEDYIIRENERKFHQTEGWSPLLEGKIAQDLGRFGEGPQVEKVLTGTYTPPPGTSRATILWLQSLAIPDLLHREWYETSYKDFQKGWKKVKERTTSGDLHFGHFKASVDSTKIGELHYKLSMLPMQIGFSPERWKKGTDVMILKAPEVYFLDKLRTIVLYEADFNHENRRLGKDAMTLALEKDLIAKEQFSRPGRSAQDNALAKRLVFDHFRFLKLPFGMCACDLTSCYDRVVHTAASIALQRVGVPKPRLKCMFNTIQHLVHTVRTAYGKSEKTFGGDSQIFHNMPQGLGQGNGAGPTVWSILSSTIFEILHSQGFSSTFCSALSLGLLKLCGFAYVDDCDLVAEGFTVGEVYDKLQGVLTMWDELMQVNGASIAPDKCWWYLIDFQWTGGKWKYTHHNAALQLMVRDKTYQVHSLQRLQHTEAREMVGVHLAPSGQEKTQVQILRKKTTTWAENIRHSPLDEDAVWTALKHTIPKTIEYPLAATTLTEPQLQHVMAPALMAALPRANIVRTFPRTVLYGPASAQGLGLTDPFIYQYCRHIQDIIVQPWRKTEVGQLITVNMEAAKLEAGLYGSLFDSEMEVTWFNTTNSWIIDTYKFCRLHDIAFDEEGDSLSPNCQRDQAIMAAFSTSGYSKHQLLSLNRCRLYAQVISVSDVTNGKGTKLLFSHTKTPHRMGMEYKYNWPQQGKPTLTEWHFWVQALKTTFANSGESLQYKMGLWNDDSNLRWTELLDNNGILYTHEDGQWWKYYPRAFLRDCTPVYSVTKDPAGTPPNRCKRTRIIRFPNYMKTTGFRLSISDFSLSPHTIVQDGSFETLLSKFPDTQWICQWMQLPEELDTLIRSLQAGNGHGVSDGSYRQDLDMCSAAWILTTKDIEIRGGGCIPTPEGDSSAYRAELGGLLGLLLVLLLFETLLPPTAPYDIIIGCDGKSALFKAMTGDREYFNASCPSFDLIARILSIREQLKARIKPVHVRGHQDQNGKKLTYLETLNVRMDSLAKAILNHNYANDEDLCDSLPPMKGCLPLLDYKNVPIVSNLSSTLVHRISETRLREYWNKKERYKVSFAEQWIDWKVVTKVMEESSTNMKKFIAKWVSRQNAVGVVQHQRQECEHDNCPVCGEPAETNLHVLRCPHPESRLVWKKGCRRIRKWMTQQRTDPELQHGLYKAIKAFGTKQHYDRYIPTGYPIAIQQCLNAQSHLGWTSFVEGFITTDWAVCQHKHYRAINSRRTGNRWAIGLSKQIWSLVFDMWHHRNHCLHHSGADTLLKGIDHVNDAIQQECNIGIGHLDSIYSSYFGSHTTLLKNPSLKKRQWLSLIRRARESQHYKYNDEIATNDSLRKWIGLAPFKQKKRQSSSLPRQFSRIGYHS